MRRWRRNRSLIRHSSTIPPTCRCRLSRRLLFAFLDFPTAAFRLACAVVQSPDSSHYDVIILGGAFSGASAALLLRREGPQLSVLVVEKSERFDE